MTARVLLPPAWPARREGDCSVSGKLYLITCSQCNEEYIGSEEGGYAETSSPDQHDFSVTQTSEHSVDDEYMRAYYEQYYKEWYRQHNIASMTTTPPATAEPTQRRQIKIKMGQPWSAPEAPSTQELPQANQSVGRAGVEGMMAGSTTTLSAEQLDKICLDIHKTTTGFGIRDPKSFALNNCPLIKMYYKQVTCEQINHVMDYCEQRSLLR
ncbi:unnamed protein product [Heligmosomoides polygyrus]|uniref:Reverse transcriptase n=1 Tax=Heligmosomoides polygyrus TaxID=6339 RepID=A0A183G6G4_HELPZ|nr:unnamed protein product [Heligmosomoides polygyrus]